MRVTLVNMPWASLDTPSLALGILHSIGRSHRAEVETVNANLDYFDWAAEAIGLQVEDYEFFASYAYFEGYGDWVFSGALHGVPQWRVREFEEQMAPGLVPHLRDVCLALHEASARFVEELAVRIADTRPDVVGFTTTFQQNTAALATAAAVKRLSPGTATVLGGANCDGPQGAALHRNFPAVDYVVRGEAERAFPALLGVVRGEVEPGTVPGLCWRGEDGAHRANDMPRFPLPPGELKQPDFRPYFTRVQSSAARSRIEPKLVLEGSRGCWWGEKHHCTFCGLNGSSMAFRSKAPETFLNEIVEQTRQHQVLDVLVVDNILDMGYLRTVLPALIDLDHDLRFHYEIKSNLRYRHLKTLADAGLVQVQPGIESLSSRVLRLMDKGVTGCQNVRHLRDAQSAGLWATWNYLYGFPGEKERDYTEVIRQFPALAHLTPPDGVTRIEIERFSPYFDRPELGFAPLRPASHYGVVYDLPEAELYDLAYLFDAPHAGIDETVAKELGAAVERWRDQYLHSSLTRYDIGSRIVLTNRREDFDWTTRTITDPVEVAAFRLLEDPRSVQSLTHRLSARFTASVSPARVAELLAEWGEAGLLFEDAGRYVHVVPLGTNAELTRLGGAAPDLTRDFARAPGPAHGPGAAS
ncbi:RiPP maturation radical SAM C-methyltransferase [Streptomyces yangpuensis]